MITTFSKPIIEFWAEKKVPLRPAFSIDDVQYWQIDVDPKDERMKDPTYVMLATQAKLLYPHILWHRLRMPLFTVTQHGIWVTTMIGKDTGQEKAAFPLATKRVLLERAYKGPGINDDVRFKQVLSKDRMVKMLESALAQGLQSVALFSTPEFIEDVPLPSVIVALQIKEDFLKRGGPIGAGQAAP